MTQIPSTSPGKLKVALAVLFGLVGVAFVVSGALRQGDIPRWMTSWWKPGATGPDGPAVGAYLVLRVDDDGPVDDQLNTLMDVVRRELRSRKILFTGLRRDDQAIVVTLTNAADRDRVLDLGAGFDVAVDGDVVRLKYAGSAMEATRHQAVDRTVQILRNRFPGGGTEVPVIERVGATCIFVDLSGVSDPQRARDLIEQPARLAFHLVVDPQASTGDYKTRLIPSERVVMPKWVPPEDRRRLAMEGRKPEVFVLEAEPFLTGDHLVQVVPMRHDGASVVSFRFDVQGTRSFARVTNENVGRNIAIVLDEEVISAPRIVGPITGGAGNITGPFTEQSAPDLALLLTAGALPASITVLKDARTRPGAGYDRFECGGEPGASGRQAAGETF